MNFKEFIRPTKWRIVLALVLSVLYFIMGFFCSPIFVDTFDSENLGPGMIFPCGETISIFTILVSFTFESPIFGIVILFLVYVISCLIIFLINKIKKNNRKTKNGKNRK